MTDFIVVNPIDLRQFWPQVREGLDAMPAEDWIAEDVYHAIKSGQVALHIAIGNQGYEGFLVLQRLATEFTNQPILHVWLAHNAGGGDVYETGQSLIRQTAANIGAKKITFGSPRKGWAKRYPLVSATYEIPMENA